MRSQRRRPGDRAGWYSERSVHELIKLTVTPSSLFYSTLKPMAPAGFVNGAHEVLSRVERRPCQNANGYGVNVVAPFMCLYMLATAGVLC